MDRYDNWIKQNYPTLESAIGRCAEAVIKMQESFPELTRVRGIAHTFLHGEQTHWWLLDSAGNVVDPTIKQFGSVMYYEALDDNDPRCKYKRQKCMNCGEVFYSERHTLCSDQCEYDFI